GRRCAALATGTPSILVVQTSFPFIILRPPGSRLFPYTTLFRSRAQQEEEPHEVLHLHRAGRADRRGPARARRPVHPPRGRRPPRRRRRHRRPAVPGRRGRQPGRRGPPGRDQQLVDAVRRRNRDRGRLTHTSMTAGHGPRGRAGVLPPALPVLLERPGGESMSQTNPRKITYADLDRLSGEVLPGRLLLSAV